MKFYSTKNKQDIVTAEQAIVNNLCPLAGLYMPEQIPLLKDPESLKSASISQIGFEIARLFFSDSFSEKELEQSCNAAFNFDVPLISLTEDLKVLELTHGPSLAFKDFGARFMAQLLSLIAQRSGRKFQVLTATSGDTGGAVAAALYNKPGIEVSILFPEGRISEFQKGQMTRWADNIRTIEVAGSFDDCQRLVKQAFLDPAFSQNSGPRLVSANSINISRLIAQTVYYIHAVRLLDFKRNISFVVPSGNLGNLTAGVFAATMLGGGYKFIAAHNLNRTFPDYLSSGKYLPRQSVRTLSNAMDVGAPSNFDRMECFFGSDTEKFSDLIKAVVVDDQQTSEQIKKTKELYNYLVCPHTAVALKAAEQIQGMKVVLATADPAKFAEVLKMAGFELHNPELLKAANPATFRIGALYPELLELLSGLPK